MNTRISAAVLAQLVGLSALWGASFLFIRVASPVLGPQVLAALRISLATVTLAIIMRYLQQKWSWEHWRELLLIGLLSVALPFLLYAWAALHLPAGYSALLNVTAVAFGTLASAWLKVETMTARKLWGCALGFAGVACVVRLGPIALSSDIILAVFACLGAAFCYGLSTPLMKRAVGHMEPLAIAGGIHALALVVLLPGAAWTAGSARFTLPAMLAVGVMGVVTSALAYWIHLRLLRHIPASAAMTPAFLIPIFGVTWGHIFLGEPLSAGMALGAALVLAATALITGVGFAKTVASANVDAANATP